MRDLVWSHSKNNAACGHRTWLANVAEELDAPLLRRRGGMPEAKLDTYFSKFDRIILESTPEEQWACDLALKHADKVVVGLQRPWHTPWMNKEPKSLEVVRRARRVWTTDLNFLGDDVDGTVIVSRYIQPYVPHAQRSTHSVGLLSAVRITAEKNVDAPIRVGYRGQYVIAGRPAFGTEAAAIYRTAKKAGAEDLFPPSDNTPHSKSPWAVRWPGRDGISYLGGYESCAQVPWEQATAYVWLPRVDSGVRAFDYSPIEAIDHGLTVVAPRHVFDGLDYNNVARTTFESSKDPGNLYNVLLYAERSVNSPVSREDDLALHDRARVVRTLLG